jgi:hypothetical protein
MLRYRERIEMMRRTVVVGLGEDAAHDALPRHVTSQKAYTYPHRSRHAINFQHNPHPPSVPVNLLMKNTYCDRSEPHPLLWWVVVEDIEGPLLSTRLVLCSKRLAQVKEIPCCCCW